ncbi:MAG: hypothetical protein PHZ24_06775 [Bacteroidales bacterium]|nr:hypothetical protein [Bacteroidales bacterium]
MVKLTIIFFLVIITLNNCSHYKNYFEDQKKSNYCSNCLDIQDYLDFKVSFDTDTIKYGDSLEIQLTFINKTDDTISFYPKSFIQINDCEEQINFKYYRVMFLDVYEYEYKVKINPLAEHSEIYNILIIDKPYYFEKFDMITGEFFVIGNNKLCLYYIPRCHPILLNDKTSCFDGGLVDTNLSLFVLE